MEFASRGNAFAGLDSLAPHAGKEWRRKRRRVQMAAEARPPADLVNLVYAYWIVACATLALLVVGANSSWHYRAHTTVVGGVSANMGNAFAILAFMGRDALRRTSVRLIATETVCAIGDGAPVTTASLAPHAVRPLVRSVTMIVAVTEPATWEIASADQASLDVAVSLQHQMCARKCSRGIRELTRL